MNIPTAKPRALPFAATEQPQRRVWQNILGLATLAVLGMGSAQAATSVKLKDVIASQTGQGTINLFNTQNPKDVVTGATLEALRKENKGSLVFGVDVNEAANTGLEKVTSQAVTVKSVKLTVVLDKETKTYQSTTLGAADNCCTTETQTPLLAAAGSTLGQGPYYTLIGHAGSNSITGNDQSLKGVDSTLTVKVPDDLSKATSAILTVVLLDTNAKKGDTEAYYGFSGGNEDLALLNAADAAAVNKDAAGRGEAPAMKLTSTTSQPLQDKILESTGKGDIDLLKDSDAKSLEALRKENDGSLVFGVDVKEAASGTETSNSQGVAVKSTTLTVELPTETKVYQLTAPEAPDNQVETQTKALVADDPNTQRASQYTLIGDDATNRADASNAAQIKYDATLAVKVPDDLSAAKSAVLSVTVAKTNPQTGDPEAYYDHTGDDEDVALLNKADKDYVDSKAPGRADAPLVIPTAPATPQTVANWTYAPAADSFYFAGYEDLYPKTGDYDFNDLTVAFRVAKGLNTEGQLVTVRGTAYLITRGAAYSSDWHLKFDLPAGTVGKLTCTMQQAPNAPVVPCSTSNPTQTNGSADITLFENTSAIFTDPGSPFVNTEPGRPFVKGPKATFTLELGASIPSDSLKPPFNGYLHVRNTGQMIELLEVNPTFKDVNGFPFGMLMPADWEPPSERVSLIDAYPDFLDFVTSQGKKSANWFKTAKADKVLGVPINSTWAW